MEINKIINLDEEHLYLEEKFSDLDNFRSLTCILLITATDIETKILHHMMHPLQGKKFLVKTYNGNQTYYIGIFGKYPAVSVQCEIGSIGRSSSIITVNDSIGSWFPKAIVMPGIAFGIDSKKQNIGDVLISEAIIPYDNKRVGSNDVIFRSPIPLSGQILLNRFRNCKKFYNVLENGENAKIQICHILSGETLIDNLEFRDKIIREFPNAKGGEMEGAGVFTAASSAKLECIIVKGICDFADGNKSENKHEFQKIAAASSVKLCLEVFSSEHAFNDLGLKIYKTSNAENDFDSDIAKKALFNIYSLEFEKYYLKRKLDLDICEILNFYGVWLSGPCGVGKTNLLIRHLQINNRNYLFVDLSKSISRKENDIYECILYDLCEKLRLDIYVNFEVISTGRYFEKIIEIICKYYSDNDLYIYIDEVPIGDNKELIAFLDKILAIQISICNKSPKTNLKIIISTINDPEPYVKCFQQKIKEKIKFVNSSTWENYEIEQLLILLCNEIKISFSVTEIQKIINSSNGSPRYIKNFLRNHISFANNPNWNFDRLLFETTRELSI